MTRCFAVLFLVILVSGAARLRPSDSNKDDKDKFQGEWVVASEENFGQKNGNLNEKKLTVKDNEWLTSWSNLKLTFKFDPSKNPKELDLYSEANGKQSTWPGIYKLEGDTLTFCRSAGPNGERPKDFQGGMGAFLMVFKRAAK